MNMRNKNEDQKRNEEILIDNARLLTNKMRDEQKECARQVSIIPPQDEDDEDEHDEDEHTFLFQCNAYITFDEAAKDEDEDTFGFGFNAYIEFEVTAKDEDKALEIARKLVGGSYLRVQNETLKLIGIDGDTF